MSTSVAIPRDFVQECQKRDRTTIVFTDGNIVCGKKRMAMPTYVDSREALTSLLQERRRLQQEHAVMIKDIIHGERLDSTSFDAIAMAITENETKIETILVSIKRSPQQHAVEQKIPNTPKERAQKFVADVEAMRRAKYLAALESGRFVKSDGAPTPVSIKPKAAKPKAKPPAPAKERTPSPESVAESDSKRERAFSSEKDSAEKSEPERPHSLSPKNSRTTTGNDVKVAPKKVQPKKPPVVVLSPEDKNVVRKQIKDMLKELFKFQDVTECTSKQRSKPFFTTKESILKAIDANPDLKKLMPKNYKSLNKDQLCKHFYQEQ